MRAYHSSQGANWNLARICRSPPVTSQLLPQGCFSDYNLVIYDSYTDGGTGGALAAGLPLRGGPVRTSLRKRRDAGRNWMEAGMSFRVGRVQSHPRRFFGGL